MRLSPSRRSQNSRAAADSPASAAAQPSTKKISPEAKKRYRTIVGMVVRFGMQIWWLNRTSTFRSKAAKQARLQKLYQQQAKTFCETATRLGGLTIKLGQHLSTHIEVLPKVVIDELVQLQDAVPPAPSDETIAQIEAEFKKPLNQIYANFQREPLASASLGQVYKASLLTGEPVAVKVLRPNIEETIAVDLEALRTSIRLMDRFTSVGNYINTDALFDDFNTTISRELNLKREMANAERIRENFAGNDRIYIPHNYAELTSQRVLTMEFVSGTKINNLPQLDAQGIDREALARTLVEAYFQMFITDGFFHADPHPGNFLIADDGTLIMLDFGMVSSLPKDTRDGFVDLIAAFTMKDSAQAAHIFSKLGFLRPGVDTSAFEKSLDLFLENFNDAGIPRSPAEAMDNFGIDEADLEKVGSVMGGTSMGAAANSFGSVASDMGTSTGGEARSQSAHARGRTAQNVSEDLLEEFSDFMRDQPFQLPDHITFLFKAVTSTLSLCGALAPDLNPVQIITDQVKKGSQKDSDSSSFIGRIVDAFTGGEGSVSGNVVDTVLDQGKDILQSYLPVVRKIPRVITDLDRGDISVKISKTQQRQMFEAQEQQSRRIVWALIGAVLVLVGVLLLGDNYASLAHQTAIAYGSLVAGAAVLLLQTRKQKQNAGRKRRRAPHPTPGRKRR